jgi:hypothetical protein
VISASAHQVQPIGCQFIGISYTSDYANALHQMQQESYVIDMAALATFSPSIPD